jgi:2-methylisocitrate lyase-like PEP mutase family enzyme
VTPAARLRRLLDAGGLIVAPGVYDGISATLVRRLGFSAAFMTGAGVSAAAYGLPDIGLLSQTEMAERARTLSGLLEIPLIADADTGYGSPINVTRTVREYERAGVAAIQLEDQVAPKRCGHITGKEVVDAADFELVLRAAQEARDDPDTVIVARTDARATLGLDEAIARGRRYAAAGADVIFVEAPQSEQEIEAIAREIPGPLLINIVPGGLTPQLDASRLAELGFRIAIHPVTALFASANASARALAGIEGASSDPPPEFTSPQGFFELFGLGEWAELGRRYSAGDQQPTHDAA